MNSIQSAIDKQPPPSRRPRPGERQHVGNLGEVARSGLPPPTIEDFNRKLTETDSYLQILISQFAKLDERIANSTSETEKEALSSLKEQSVYLLDSIKHTIVLLQIAKVKFFFVLQTILIFDF